MSDLIRKGRPVYTPDWGVGVVVAEEETLGMWLVSTVGGPLKAYEVSQLTPLVTTDQRIKLEIEGMEKGSALAERVKPFGLSSDDLADFCGEFILESVGRIKGVGKDQYDNGGFQKFEGMELDDLLEYTEEEVLDIANYAAMLFIRVRRLRQALDSVDTLGRGTEEEYEAGNVTGGDFEDGGEGEPSYN